MGSEGRGGRRSECASYWTKNAASGGVEIFSHTLGVNINHFEMSYWKTMKSSMDIDNKLYCGPCTWACLDLKTNIICDIHSSL